MGQTISFSKTLLAGLIIMFVFSLSSCSDSKPSYDVNFYFPDAKTSNQLLTFIYDYGLKERGINVSADSLFALADNLQKKYLGGVGVNGTMILDDDYIEFKPGFISSMTYDGFSSFKIPYSDMDSAKSEPFLLIMKAVVVNTKNGEFKFQLTKAKHWYNPFKFDDEDICKQLNQKIAK